MPRFAPLVAAAAALLASGTARGEGGGLAFEPGPPPFATVLAKAKAEKKVVFVDFTTAWCGWCKKLEQDTFSQPTVAAAMTGFVCVHVDAEKGEGPTLAKRYGAHGFPTMVVVDDAGEEVDRIVGYLPPAPFTTEIQRIARGENTLKSLRRAVAADPKDLGAALDLATKLVENDPEAAERVLKAIPADAKPNDAQAGKKALLLAQALQESNKYAEALAAYLAVVEGVPGTSAARTAVARGASLAMRMGLDAAEGFFAKAKAAGKTDADRAWVEAQTFPLHLALAARALERQADLAADDASTLNDLAWQAFEFRHDRRFAQLLPKAIEWARKAVKLSAESADTLDTLASLLAVTGEVDEAIAVEEKAAAKATDPALRAQAQRNVANWKAARDAQRPKAAPPTPATPPAPATPTPPPPRPSQPR
jgi:thiol-disulfide isomerase/thioredoxin